MCIRDRSIQPSFFNPKGRCQGNQFSGKNGAKLPYPLHLLLCHSETEWDIALQICALITPLIALHRVKNGENWLSSFWFKVGEEMKIVPRLGRNWTIFVHLAYWRSETDWNFTILILAG